MNSFHVLGFWMRFQIVAPVDLRDSTADSGFDCNFGDYRHPDIWTRIEQGKCEGNRLRPLHLRFSCNWGYRLVWDVFDILSLTLQQEQVEHVSSVQFAFLVLWKDPFTFHFAALQGWPVSSFGNDLTHARSIDFSFLGYCFAISVSWCSRERMALVPTPTIKSSSYRKFCSYPVSLLPAS